MSIKVYAIHHSWMPLLEKAINHLFLQYIETRLTLDCTPIGKLYSFQIQDKLN